MNYLFGYGSLINKRSRSLTGKTYHAYPARLLDFRREWNVIVPSMKMIGLGVFADAGSSCNGVLIEIDATEIRAFDEREIKGSDFNYERIAVRPELINANITMTNARIWTYVVKERKKPNWDFPIAQSYVDVMLMGCLEYGERFVSTFIMETMGWEHPWVNDRDFPRYIRKVDETQQVEYLDLLLRKYIPNQYANRKTILE